MCRELPRLACPRSCSKACGWHQPPDDVVLAHSIEHRAATLSSYSLAQNYFSTAY